MIFRALIAPINRPATTQLSDSPTNPFHAQYSHMCPMPIHHMCFSPCTLHSAICITPLFLYIHGKSVMTNSIGAISRPNLFTVFDLQRHPTPKNTEFSHYNSDKSTPHITIVHPYCSAYTIPPNFWSIPFFKFHFSFPSCFNDRENVNLVDRNLARNGENRIQHSTENI